MLIEGVAICRLCLSHEKISVNLLEESSSDLLRKITTCLPIAISEDDRLPKTICSECYYKVHSFYEFWNTTLASESQMLEWITHESNDVQTCDNPKINSTGYDDLSQGKCRFSGEKLENGHVLSNEVSFDEKTNNNTPLEDNENDSNGLEDESNGKNERDNDSDVEFIGILREGDKIDNFPITVNCIKTEYIAAVAKSINTFTNVNYNECSSIQNGDNTTLMNEQYNESDNRESIDNSLSHLSKIFHMLSSPEEFIDLPIDIPSPPATANASLTAAVSNETIHRQQHDDKPESSTANDCNSKSIETAVPPTMVLDAATPYKCDVCSKSFSCEDLLAMHRLSQCGDDVSSCIECSVCRERFDSVTLLTNHMKSHHSQFNCDECGKLFLTRHQLQVHSCSTHLDSRPFCCAKCGTSFRYKKTFETHVKIHANEKPISDEQQLFICEVCEQRFSTRNSYVHHARSHKNTTNKCKLMCFACNQTFTSKRMLSQHIRTQCCKKVYNCDVCGKELFTKESLECHKLIHVDEKSLVCQTCGKKFSHRKYFVVHQRIHTGERPYKCVTCDKTFTQASTLAVHRRYHTGERPYKCKVCDKGFVTRTIMLSHSKYHEAVENL